MNSIHFYKYQGIGNDFVLIDCTENEITISSELSRFLCDRHFGIGADGVLYLSLTDDYVDKLTIHNADGSVAEMCGNGLRCVARYLHDNCGRPEEFMVQTDAGRLEVSVDEAVTVQIAAPHDMGEIPLHIENLPATGRGVDVGNPHLVIEGDFTYEDMLKFGPLLTHHEAFPNGVNVEFATLKSDHIQIYVYERGVGPTLACGTGSCATAAAFIWRERISNNAVRVKLPGGELTVHPAEPLWKLEGPALEVFEGNLFLK